VGRPPADAETEGVAAMEDSSEAPGREARRGPGSSPIGAGGLEVLFAATMGAAGLVHLVMAPVHAGGSTAEALGFAVFGWIQVTLALSALLGRWRRGLWAAAVAVNLVAIALWIWSRTAGLPFGSHSGSPEPVALVDGVTVALETGALVVAAALLAAPARLKVGWVVPSLAAVAVLGATTAVVVSPETAQHADHEHGGSGDEADVGFADMADIDERRCDLGMNPAGYWAEARRTGVDTYYGGAMQQPLTAEELVAIGELRSSPGTPALDALISATSLAAGGEAAAGALVAELGKADDVAYDRWVTYLRSLDAGAATGDQASGSAHDHGTTSSPSPSSGTAPDDNGGHGGHIGPQPWVAMVDQPECDALDAELDRARDVAMALPTAADAMAAGYVKTTTYVPGIAAHYMRFPYVDGTFSIDEPEMLLYDGEGPEAHVVGLSYYVLHPGDAEPTQGFTGPNDHFHRHVGLCVRGALVVGDSTTSEEDCAARGGRKSDGGAGWMNHVWVVQGCESPWGVFSGASPTIDQALGEISGSDGGGCAGSGAAQRYDLSAGSLDSVRAPGELAAGD
jgi:hypothetical protein